MNQEWVSGDIRTGDLGKWFWDLLVSGTELILLFGFIQFDSMFRSWTVREGGLLLLLLSSFSYCMKIINLEQLSHTPRLQTSSVEGARSLLELLLILKMDFPYSADIQSSLQHYHCSSVTTTIIIFYITESQIFKTFKIPWWHILYCLNIWDSRTARMVEPAV